MVASPSRAPGVLGPAVGGSEDELGIRLGLEIVEAEKALDHVGERFRHGGVGGDWRVNLAIDM